MYKDLIRLLQIVLRYSLNEVGIKRFIYITLGTFFVIFLSFLVFQNPDYEILHGENKGKSARIQIDDSSYELIDVKSLIDESSFTNTNVKVHHSLVIKNKVLFDVEYRTDQFGRRFVPSEKKGDQFLIVSGCSFVFGIGVNEEQSLPFILQQELPQYHVYNYGTPGAGTNHMLSEVESNILQNEISEKQGVFIYVYIDGHVSRAMGSLGPIVKATAPYYSWENGQPKRHGTFGSAEPIWTWFRTVILQSWLSKFIAIESYNHVTPKSIQKICSMIKKAQTDFNQQFPSSKFVVFFHPAELVTKNELSQCLDSKNVSYFSAKYQHTNDLLIPHDLHPNSEGNLKTAQEIRDYILK